jgi:hypothetical protein
MIRVEDEEIFLFLRERTAGQPWVLLYGLDAPPEAPFRMAVLSNCDHPEVLIEAAAETPDDFAEVKSVRPA